MLRRWVHYMLKVPRSQKGNPDGRCQRNVQGVTRLGFWHGVSRNQRRRQSLGGIGRPQDINVRDVLKSLPSRLIVAVTTFSEHQIGNEQPVSRTCSLPPRPSRLLTRLSRSHWVQSACDMANHGSFNIYSLHPSFLPRITKRIIELPSKMYPRQTAHQPQLIVIRWFGISSNRRMRSRLHLLRLSFDQQ